MKRIFILLPLLAILCLTSCSTQSYVSSFANFVDKTDANCEYYSLSQWERNVDKFKNYSITRFNKEKGNLSNEQIKEILKLDARYIGIVSSQHVLNVSDIIK